MTAGHQEIQCLSSDGRCARIKRTRSGGKFLREWHLDGGFSRYQELRKGRRRTGQTCADGGEGKALVALQLARQQLLLYATGMGVLREMGNSVRHTQLLGHQQQECKSDMGEGATHDYCRRNGDCFRKGNQQQAPCYWVNNGATVYLNSGNTGLGKHRSVSASKTNTPARVGHLNC